MKADSKIRSTKIVCTIGPATSTGEQIRQLMLAGMDVARLNFSHGDHDTHRKSFRIIRQISEELGKEIGILQDLGGPKIRVGKLPVQERQLQAGEKVVLSPKSTSEPSVIPVNYPYLVEDVEIGSRILMADGLIELQVEEKQEDRLFCRVVVAGVVQSHKGINLPSSNLRVPAFKGDRDQIGQK